VACQILAFILCEFGDLPHCNNRKINNFPLSQWIVDSSTAVLYLSVFIKLTKQVTTVNIAMIFINKRDEYWDPVSLVDVFVIVIVTYVESSVGIELALRFALDLDNVQ